MDSETGRSFSGLSEPHDCVLSAGDAGRWPPDEISTSKRVLEFTSCSRRFLCLENEACPINRWPCYLISLGPLWGSGSSLQIKEHLRTLQARSLDRPPARPPRLCHPPHPTQPHQTEKVIVVDPRCCPPPFLCPFSRLAPRSFSPPSPGIEHD